MKGLSLSPHGRNIRFICCEFNSSFNAFSGINCHKEVTSLFQRNRYDRLYDFVTSRFNVLFLTTNLSVSLDNIVVTEIGLKSAREAGLLVF